MAKLQERKASAEPSSTNLREIEYEGKLPYKVWRLGILELTVILNFAFVGICIIEFVRDRVLRFS